MASNATDSRIAALTQGIQDKIEGNKKKEETVEKDARAKEALSQRVIAKWQADEPIIAEVIERAKNFVPNPPLVDIKYTSVKNIPGSAAVANGRLDIVFGQNTFKVGINVFPDGRARFYYDTVPGFSRDSGADVDVFSAGEEEYSKIILEEVLKSQVDQM